LPLKIEPREFVISCLALALMLVVRRPICQAKADVFYEIVAGDTAKWNKSERTHFVPVATFWPISKAKAVLSE
jgi:hypothetical protein